MKAYLGFTHLLICYLHPLGKHTFASPLASANSGEISLSLKPAIPQPTRVT